VHHVGQHPEAGDAVVTAEQFDQCVGVGDRGRLVADHHYHFLGGANEADHRVADTGSGVDQQYVQLVTNVTEGLDQPGVLTLPEVDHVRCAGGCRNNADAPRALHQDVAQFTFTGQYVGQGGTGAQAQLYVDVGQSQVGIHQHYATAQLGQGHGQIDRYVGLANAALAAGDCNYLYRLIAHLYLSPLSSH
jgi:hypothetical protein